MATITIGLTSGVVTGSKTYTLSDPDVTRWINAAKTAWPPRDVAGKVIPNPTNAQALASWADEVMARTKRIVKDIEGKAAGPSEITVTGN